MQTTLKLSGKLHTKNLNLSNKINIIFNLGQSAARTLSTCSAAMASSAALSSKYKFETLLVSTPKDYVYNVQLNRPQQFNAMNSTMWRFVLVRFTGF
jgi:hypothetical protein